MQRGRAVPRKGFMEEETHESALKRFSKRITLLFVVTAVIPVVIMALVYAFIPDYDILFAKHRELPSSEIKTVLQEITLIALAVAVVVGAAAGVMLSRSILAPFSVFLDSVGRLTSLAGAGGRKTDHSRASRDIKDSISRAAGELSLTMGLLERIMITMEDALVVLEKGDRIRTVNKALVDMLGYPEEEIIGEGLDRICKEKRAVDALLSRMEKEGSVRGLELHCLSAGGEEIPVSVTAAPFKAEDEAAGLTILLLRDLRRQNALRRELETTREELTKRVRDLEEFREGILYMLRNLDQSERELQEAYTKLKETQAQLVQSTKLTALGELTAGLAHELNQPLTVIRGLAQHLFKRADEDSPEYDKLRIIDDATRKMEKVINHLRVFSRLDEQRFELTDLNKVIEDAFLMINQLLRKRRINVEFNLSPLPLIMGNANRLEQVVINLVANARDAMPNGGTLRISTGCIEKEGTRYVRASFRDSGCGIPKGIIDRIFEPFFTTKEVGQGTGLGLSISYGIVRDHHGEITVESSVGQGSTFHITIPVAPEDTGNDGNEKNA